MRISKFLLQKVGEAEMIPTGYGLAYWDFAMAEGIFFLIPLNLFVRFGVWLYWNTVYSFPFTRVEAKLKKECDRARYIGYQNGYRDGQRDFWDKILKRINEKEKE